MQTTGGEQQVMREYPIPVADIERREKRGESGREVEIRQEVVQYSGKPYLTGYQRTSIAGQFLCDAYVDIVR